MIFEAGIGVHFSAPTVFDTTLDTTPSCPAGDGPSCPCCPAGDRRPDGPDVDGDEAVPSPSCLLRLKEARLLLINVEERSTRLRIRDGEADLSDSLEGLPAALAATGDFVGVDIMLDNEKDDKDGVDNDSNPFSFCLNDQLSGSGDEMGDSGTDLVPPEPLIGVEDSLDTVK